MKTKKGDECSLWYQEEGQEPVFLTGKVKTPPSGNEDVGVVPLVVTVRQPDTTTNEDVWIDVDYENRTDNGIYWVKL